MEFWLKELTGYAALLMEIVTVLLVLLGGGRAVLDLLKALAEPQMSTSKARIIWVRFATAILLALEFALGADIIRTAVAPTWDDIGQLASIAAIRTGLGFFLGRDIEVFSQGEKIGILDE